MTQCLVRGQARRKDRKNDFCLLTLLQMYSILIVY
jgi:hypothetical protein